MQFISATSPLQMPDYPLTQDGAELLVPDDSAPRYLKERLRCERILTPSFHPQSHRIPASQTERGNAALGIAADHFVE